MRFRGAAVDGNIDGMEQPIYEDIGRGYAGRRCEDPRVAARIRQALGTAERVVNVGAGAGSYDRVTAVWWRWSPPRRCWPNGWPPRHRPSEALPFPERSFDAALAVLTLHHWSDLDAGLAELRRVAPRQVLFLFEPAEVRRFWAIEYFPEAAALPSERRAPGVELLRRRLAVREVVVVPIPFDCTDGFGAAYWGRPEAYLDPAVQASQSWLAQLSPTERGAGGERLASDLRSGRWDQRFGHLRHLPELDVGYRLVVAEDARTAGRRSGRP